MHAPCYNDTMTQTITAKYRLYVDDPKPFIEVSEAYRDACNFVSERVASEGPVTELPDRNRFQKRFYATLRAKFGLKSQMAISVTWTVHARYSTLITQIRDSEKAAEAWDKRKAELEAKGRKPNTKRPKVIAWTLIRFRALQCDQVADRDWSVKTPCSNGRGVISVNTLGKRLECPYIDKGFEQYRSCRRGTAKLVIRNDGKVFLHVSINREVPDVPESVGTTVVGIDRGLRFHAVTHDGKHTKFYSGREAVKVRARYKSTRQSLQKRGTPSSRRRLKRIGSRESRWMHDRNSCIAKTLVSDLEPGSVIVLEDLSGVRSATEVVKRKDRYLAVSWPYYDLQMQIEYKAAAKGIRVIYVNPAHTSQTCPHCGNVDKNARHRDRHEYVCPKCGFRTNDDRAAAMNIRARGMEQLDYKFRVGTRTLVSVPDGSRGRGQPPHDVTSPAGPSAPTECETTGIKAGRPCQADGTGGQSQTPGLCPAGS